MKRYGKLLPAIVIAAVVFRIVIFAAPVPKTAVLWISDAFALFSLASLLIVDKLAFRKADSAKSRFYGLPVLRLGVRYVEAILLCAVAFILLSCVIRPFPVWLPVVVYVVLTGAAAVGLIAADGARESVEEQESKTAADTAFLRDLRTGITPLAAQTADAGLSRALGELAEQLRYSDPVSSPAAADLEAQMADEAARLRAAVKAEDWETALRLCRSLSAALAERNAVCKANKGK